MNEKKCDSQLGGRGGGWRIALTRPSDGYFASYIYVHTFYVCLTFYHKVPIIYNIYTFSE